MPFYCARILPVHLCRRPEDGGTNEDIVETLEEMNNRTMVNVIRQLANLTELAHDIFVSLEHESELILKRSDVITQKIENLSGALEGFRNSKEKRLQGFSDIYLQERSLMPNFGNVSRFLTPDTRPKSLQIFYEHNCEKIPNLHLMQPFYENEEDAKKYTDPEMFFNIWKEEMLREAAKAMMAQSKKSIKKKNTERTYVPHKIVTRRDQIREKELKAGNIGNYDNSEEEKELELITSTPPLPLYTEDPSSRDSCFDLPAPPNDDYFPPPLEDGSDVEDKSFLHSTSTQPPLESHESVDLLPPPPPPSGLEDFSLPPPPPPPPPPSAIASETRIATNSINKVKNQKENKQEPKKQEVISPISSNNDLLKQIQAGKKLKKTSNVIREKKELKSLNNVEDILTHVLESRRAALEEDDDDDSSCFEDD